MRSISLSVRWKKSLCLSCSLDLTNQKKIWVLNTLIHLLNDTGIQVWYVYQISDCDVCGSSQVIAKLVNLENIYIVQCVNLVIWKLVNIEPKSDKSDTNYSRTVCGGVKKQKATALLTLAFVEKDGNFTTCWRKWNNTTVAD